MRASTALAAVPASAPTGAPHSEQLRERIHHDVQKEDQARSQPSSYLYPMCTTQVFRTLSAVGVQGMALADIVLVTECAGPHYRGRCVCAFVRVRAHVYIVLVPASGGLHCRGRCVCKLVITPWQEDNGYVPLANPETSRKAKPGEVATHCVMR